MDKLCKVWGPNLLESWRLWIQVLTRLGRHSHLIIEITNFPRFQKKWEIDHHNSFNKCSPATDKGLSFQVQNWIPYFTEHYFLFFVERKNHWNTFWIPKTVCNILWLNAVMKNNLAVLGEKNSAFRCKSIVWFKDKETMPFKVYNVHNRSNLFVGNILILSHWVWGKSIFFTADLFFWKIAP